MKTMKWLLRREFWEHKGALLWAPLVVGGAMVAFIGSLIGYAISQGKFSGTLRHDGGSTDLATAFASMSPEKQLEIGNIIANSYMGTTTPLFLMMGVIIFFYCLAALHDERRDRSILFWKSLPVSDTQTVLAKVLTAAVVAPMITIAVGVVVALLLATLAGIFLAVHGVNLFGLVLSDSEFYLLPLRLIGLLPVYIVWALPTIGWLMLVSAWAKSKVFLWAVGTPLIAMLVIKWSEFLFGTGVNLDWVMQHVISRGLVGLIPGIWLPMTEVDVNQLANGGHEVVMSAIFAASWKSLASMPALLGALAGAAMIFGAIRLRRWKDEG
jgi:ABC-2 type transport system permease protein